MAQNPSSPSRKLRWGVLSTAKIGTAKVIPAMQRGERCEVVAIGSRDLERARQAAARLGIPRVHGSYEDVLADPEVDAVFIPLPNHLHVLWSLRALEAGKHVLCEKPVGLDAAEARTLADAAARHPELRVMEAFMYRHHPQWRLAKQIVDSGGIGELRTVHTFFSYFNDDASNIRNDATMGGGGLMDIGCYAVSLSRWLFGSEPRRVLGVEERDPRFGVDRMASGVLEFDNGTATGVATFTCSTQLVPYQRVQVYGTTGRVEIEIPFNAPPDRPCRLWHEQNGTTEELTVDACDQYTVQGDLFAAAVLDGGDVPTPLSDAVANMRVIDALKESAA